MKSPLAGRSTVGDHCVGAQFAEIQFRERSFDYRGIRLWPGERTLEEIFGSDAAYRPAVIALSSRAGVTLSFR